MQSITLKEKKNPKNEDLNRIFQYILLRWKLLLICGLVGGSLAFIYNYLKVKQYTVSTSILIPAAENTLDTRDLFFKALPYSVNTNLNDQIGIIKSFYTINQTVLNLNRRTSIYRRNLFTWKLMYKNEPFNIQELDSLNNLKGIRIFLTPSSHKRYKITVNGSAKINELKQMIKFEDEGEFDRPYINQYFHFTINRSLFFQPVIGKQYYFIFNDFDEETIRYYNLLDISLRNKNSNIIECKIKGNSPVRDVEFLNELIKFYIKGKINLQNQAQIRSLEFINDQLAGISDSLNLAGRRFSNFRSQNNVIDLGAEGNLIMNNLKDLQTELAQSQVQLNYYQDLSSYLKENNDLKKMVSPSVVGIQDAGLNSLVLKLSDLYNRRQILGFSVKDNNVTVKLLDKELYQIRDQLNENLRNLIKNTSNSINSLKQRIYLINTNLNRLPQKEQQMVSIQRQFNLTNDIYTFLLQKRAETNISLASRIPDVHVIDIARVETAIPEGLPEKVILLSGFLLGIFIPLGIKELNSIFNYTIQKQEDVENYTDIPIMGNILHDTTKSHLVVCDHPDSLTAESFRILKTNLCFLIGSGTKVISILSMNPNEGKSFVSKNLAAVLTMNQKKVLLIGADMRRPKIHRFLNLSNEHGLSTYLIGTDPIEHVIFETKINNLWFMPSGPVPPNPSELLSNSLWKQLIDIVRQEYDFIIIDNPPFGLVSDSILISQWSDLNLFILRQGFSHKYQPSSIDRYVYSKNINHAGIIVNDVKSNVFGESYFSNYYSETQQKKYLQAKTQD